MKDGFNLMKFALFHFEHFRELPGPGIRRTARHGAAVWSLERTILAERMIEKGEAEDQPALPIDGNVPPIADPPDKMNQSRFELFLATPVGGVAGSRFRIGPCLSFA